MTIEALFYAALTLVVGGYCLYRFGGNQAQNAQWRCPNCTLLNNAYMPRCENYHSCGGLQPHSEDARPAPRSSATADQVRDNWYYRLQDRSHWHKFKTADQARLGNLSRQSNHSANKRFGPRFHLGGVTYAIRHGPECL